MEPSTLATLALVTSVAGSAMSAYGQYQSGKAQQEAYNLQAKVVERQGMQEEEASRQRLRALLGKQRALYAKAGVDLSTGSPLTVLAATAAEGEQEALTIRAGATETASFNRFSGAQAKRAGGTAAVGTLLSGLGSAKVGK